MSNIHLNMLMLASLDFLKHVFLSFYPSSFLPILFLIMLIVDFKYQPIPIYISNIILGYEIPNTRDPVLLANVGGGIAYIDDIETKNHWLVLIPIARF